MSLSYTSLKSRLDAIAARKQQAAPAPPEPTIAPSPLLDALRGAELLVGTHGRTVLLRARLKPEAPRLATAAEPFCAAGLPALCAEAPAHLAPGRIAFIDTETTGLSGGTGTVAFLVGVAWWEDGALVLEQYVMEDYCHECDMLVRLAERLRGFELLCTYNGKSFDLPLLRTRAVMARQTPKDFALPQADLLHFARRLWQGVLPSVSLRCVEKEILGIDRGDDIPGAEIPAVFFAMAQGGDASRMEAVLRHNAQDLASLAILLGMFTRVTSDPEGCGLLSRAEEFAAMARWYESRKDFRRAAVLWGEALCSARDMEQRDALRHRLALAWKRAGAWAEALATWEELARGPLGAALPAVCEIARHHERIRRDPEAALALVRRWIGRLAMEADLRSVLGRESVSPSWKHHAEDLERRERRLAARVARRSAA